MLALQYLAVSAPHASRLIMSAAWRRVESTEEVGVIKVGNPAKICLMLLAATLAAHLLRSVLFHMSTVHFASDGAQLQGEFGNEHGDERLGPELVWEEVAEAPVGRLDGAAVQIGHLLYVFAGYATIDEVINPPARLRAL